MSNIVPPSCKVSSLRRRAVSAALSLTFALVSAFVATRSAQAQTYSVVYNFTGRADGASPYASLIQDAAGNFYSTTNAGGNDSTCSALIPPGCGVVFKLDPSGNETVIYTFTGPPDGASPIAPVVMDAAGNLYGSAGGGGSTLVCFGGCGVVFKVDTSGTETVLYSFTGAADGAGPSGVVLDASRNLYGTALTGGSFSGGCPAFGGCGVVFKVDPSGKLTVLYTFKGGPDGAGPRGVIRDAGGNLYGTTSFGGTFNEGTVFKLDSSGTETVLYSFTGQSDGGAPFAGLIQDASGNLYGTTEGGGNSCGGAGCGVVFKLDPAGKETVLYPFSGPDGAFPELAGLLFDAAGNLYGVTYGGGTSCPFPGCGVVFKLDTTGKETVLHSFTGAGGDGENPSATLALDASGDLYGTTVFGGASGLGTVFKITGAAVASFDVSVVLTGNGSGTVTSDPAGINCGTTCLSSFVNGTAVALTATPASGSTFAGWSGACSGANACTVTANASMTATFNAPAFSLTPASASLALKPGGQVTDVITVAPQNGGFAGVVQLSCTLAGPASVPACTLSPSSVTPGANSVTSKLTITAAGTSGMLAPSVKPDRLHFATSVLLTLLGITFIAAWRKERRASSVLFGFLVLMLLQSACIGCGGTERTIHETNYTATVAGDSGSNHVTAQVSVTVQ